MRSTLSSVIAVGAGLALLTASVTAAVSQGKSLLTDKETGLVVKVVAGSNKIKAYSKPDGVTAAFDLELLVPYFVMEESGAYYKVTTVKAATLEEAGKGQVGYVKRDQVHTWMTREALHFTPLLATLEGREPIKGWDDKDRLKKFFESGDTASYGHTFEEDIAKSIKREKGLRPYPVLGSFKTPLRKSGRDKRVYNVLLPAAVPPGAVVVIDPARGSAKVTADQIEATLRKVTFSVVFDATGSMDKYAKEIAAEISGAIRQLSKDTFQDTRVGLVYFRDKEDAEKTLIVAPLSVQEAARHLDNYKTSGGGDAAEPVLDALYLAADYFDWDAGDLQSGAKKVIICVLNTDAHPKTTGHIDARVPPGLSPADIAQKLLDKGIIAITVQAGPEMGPHLVSTLRTIADGTGGEFIAWSEGGSKGLANQVGVAVKNRLTAVAKKTKDEAVKVATATVMEGGKLVVPLRVLEPGMLDRLRGAGLKLNIDDKAGGIIVTNGYIPENEDLMEPQILIEKEPLQGLLGLFNTLSVTAPDAKDLVETAQNAIAVITGEKANPKDRLDEIIKKKTGITFRTDLLAFDLDWFGGLTPPERLKLQKRIKEASDRLGNFLEANTKEFDRKGSLWMQVQLLP